MAMLSKEAILAADDRPTETLPVPEWGGDVMIRGMSGLDRDAFFTSQVLRDTAGNIIGQDLRNGAAKLAARSIIDPDTREPMFDLAEVEVLGRKSAKALGRVEAVAQRLSGLTEETSKELGKDSASTPSGDSGSVSPPTSEPPASEPASEPSPALSSPSGPSTTP